MIRTDELRGVIAKRGLSQRRVAKHIGISEKAFYGRMQRGIFHSDEIEKMIALLSIDCPLDIFFAPDGAYCATASLPGEEKYG